MPRSEVGSVSPQPTPYRLSALSDGVFAMTLLVLTIEVPGAEAVRDGDISQLLFALWPRFQSFGISFVVLGVYWEGHHGQFHFVHRTDQILIWLNMMFLLLISAVPFSATLLSHYGVQHAVVLFYGAHLVLVGLMQLAMCSHATGSSQLVLASLTPAEIRKETWRVLTAPSIYVVAMLLSFVSTEMSLALFACAPLIYILPGLLHRHSRRRKASKASHPIT